jgi:hypothetical protein
MIIAREDIYVAFWNVALSAKLRSSGLFPFITYSRRLKHWNNVPASEQPAMFMVQPTQTPEQTKGLPPIWNLHVQLFLYDNCGDDNAAIPGTRLNNLVDALDDAFCPTPGARQTLGNLVSHCWISGGVQLYEGFEGMMNQSVAIMPFEIRVPDASGPV